MESEKPEKRDRQKVSPNARRQPKGKGNFKNFQEICRFYHIFKKSAETPPPRTNADKSDPKYNCKRERKQEACQPRAGPNVYVKSEPSHREEVIVKKPT